MHNFHMAQQGSCSHLMPLQIFFIFESKSTCTTFIWLHEVHAHLSCVSSNILHFWKLINIRNIHMVPLGSCSFIVCLFKYSLFLKVNQHTQHSYDSTTRFMLIYLVNLQIFFDFESKSTCATFIWFHKVHAHLSCVSSNILHFWK